MTEYVRCSGCGEEESCKTFCYCDNCQTERYNTIPIKTIEDKINQLENCIGWSHYQITVKVLKDLIK